MKNENSHITLPEWALPLVTRAGYMDRFWHHRAEGLNSRQSYEQVEEELERYFKTNRYTSYASFLTSKRTWIRKQQNKKR